MATSEIRAETVSRSRLLGRRLERAREAAGIKSRSDPRVRKVGGPDKIRRIEEGKGPFKSLDIEHLCQQYGITHEETVELVELAEAITEGRAYVENADLIPRTFGVYVDLEVLANELLIYGPMAMPGLFQTAEYAEAIMRAVRPKLTDEEIARNVRIRLRRQKDVLSGPANAQIRAVIDESVFARQVGGSEVVAAQLSHLRDLCKTDRVTVRVLTFGVGATPAMRGAFTLMKFRDVEEPDSVYFESAWDAQLSNKPVQEFQKIFDALTEQSVPMERYV